MIHLEYKNIDYSHVGSGKYPPQVPKAQGDVLKMLILHHQQSKMQRNNWEAATNKYLEFLLEEQQLMHLIKYLTDNVSQLPAVDQ